MVNKNKNLIYLPSYQQALADEMVADNIKFLEAGSQVKNSTIRSQK
jgi:hypothetical protein